MLIFFLVPFALRGARLAMQSMKNDVKDWLPSDFEETKDLEDFRQRFLGEQFVVVTWEGCHGTLEDERFKAFVNKLFPETPPSQSANTDEQDTELAEANFTDEELNLYVRQMSADESKDFDEFIGNKYRLRALEKEYKNWGGAEEKWLQAGSGWAYILPNGEVYLWKGDNSIIGATSRWFERLTTGGNKLKGEYLCSFGEQDGSWYYQNPSRLSARPFKTITTGPGVLSELVREGGPLRRERNPVAAAHERLDGILFGPDGEQTCIILTLSEAAKEDIASVIGRGLLGKARGKVIGVAEQSGIAPPPHPTLLPKFLAFLDKPEVTSQPELRLGGPPVDNAAIDEEGQITLVRLIGLSVLVGLILAWICFRSWRIMAMLFFVGGISAVTSVSMVWWGGSTVDAVLMSMPSLVYVLGLSGAVHIINYYRDASAHNSLRSSPGVALQLGWRPCALAAVTTSIGLLSLLSSNILPIRKFGFFSAIGVLTTLFLLFLYLPSALQLWPPIELRREKENSAFDRAVEGFWRRVGEIVIRRHGIVSVICLVVFGFFAYGLTRVDTSIQLLKLFDGDSKIIRDYNWLEENLGKLVPMEIVIRVKSDQMDSTEGQEFVEGATPDYESLNFLERMEIVEYARRELELQFGTDGQQIIGKAMAASTFAPTLPDTGARITDIGKRSGISEAMLAYRENFIASDYLQIDEDVKDELWRISLRLGALNDVDYGLFVYELKRVIEPFLSAYEYRKQIVDHVRQNTAGDRTRGATVALVGVPPKSENDESVDANGNGVEAEDGNSINQSEIFVRNLRRLLKNEGFKVVEQRSDFELPENWDWDEVIGTFDCVALVSSDSRYAEIADNSQVLNLREHDFDPTRQAGNSEEEKAPGISAVYTGVVPVVYKAQRTLLTSLIQSTLWAFVLIAAVMMMVLRSFRAGLLSMLPNVFPLVLVFGIMCWCNIKVDIGSMMTASVAMGVAVDDTIHFLTWFRRGLDEGSSRHRAIMLAYRRVATAMTQTTAIGGLGLAVFAFSTFTPTQRFGTLMLALLAAALVGDLIFLPALLAGPLGRVFTGKEKNRGDKVHESRQAPHFATQAERVAGRSRLESA